MKQLRVTVLIFSVLVLASCANSTAGPSGSPSVSATATPSENWLPKVSNVAKTFFDEYLNCMTNPPTAAQGQVGDYCQGHNSQATSSLTDNLVAGGVAAAGADPIVCAQAFPISYLVTTANYNSATSQGQATVTEKFGSSDVLVKVALTNATGKMLVDNIVCPVP